jgi:hypothetical protein
MTVAMCKGCRKMISISRVAGGNPIALQQPDVFALRYGRCDACGMYCGDCLTSGGDPTAAQGTCPQCGAKVAIEGA